VIRGRCIYNEKIIAINLYRVQDTTDLLAVLCHEISHAVAGSDHGKRWEK
jgi:hypothetical protein